MQPLAGILVVDLSRYLPGAYASRELLRLGAGVVRVEPLISHVLPLEETERAFRMVADRQGLKLMIAMPDFS